MGQIIKTLVIEREDVEKGKEQSYNFMFEQRGNEILVLNIDTGVWKIDSSYSELMKTVNSENQSIQIDSNDIVYNQLVNDKLINHVPDEARYGEFSLLILETSEKCNLRCRYCFENATNKGANMSCETAVKAFEKFIALENCRALICVEFNGGEALLNYEMICKAVPQILRIAEDAGKKVKFTIQTNGTLLTAEMIAFFKEYNFSIGLSLDGVGEFNDNRIYSDGRSSFNEVIQNIQLLKGSGIHYSTVSVIHRENQYKSVKDLLDYTGCDQFRANLINTIGRGKDVSADTVDMKEIAIEYVAFCKQMLQDRQYYEANAMYYFLSLLLSHPFMCYKEPCGAGMNQLFVVPNGDIYLCQECCFIDKGCIGNVNLENLDIEKSIRTDRWFQTIQSRRTALIEECKICPWKKFCCSCPCGVYSETGNVSNKSVFCEFYKYIYSEFVWMIHNDTEAVMNFLQISF